MKDAISILKSEHRSISAVLHGLKELARIAQDAKVRPRFQVLRSMLRYMDEYPERLHHPKENDHIFAPLVGYWPPGRSHVDEGDRSIPFPFERLPTPTFLLEDRWGLAQLAGFIRSWSATARFVETRGHDPVPAMERELRALWPDPAEPRRITWPVVVLTGRVS